jgi:hypothetical protein
MGGGFWSDSISLVQLVCSYFRGFAFGRRELGEGSRGLDGTYFRKASSLLRM